MEYLDSTYLQRELAMAIKKTNLNIRNSCIIPLIPSKLERSFPNKIFEQWMQPIDRVITFGHSLSEYLEKKGVSREKIITSFHYVDKYYYKETTPITSSGKIKVIAMGNQARNIKLLIDIVKKNPEVDFTICQGCLDLREIFYPFKNVSLIPFIDEEKLREYMNESDVSLNVMEDTIGSNVIVTSMAMGLGMICSDVGSIRDYCDETNTIFCDNNDVNSFSKAIYYLSTNKELLKAMKESSILNAKKFSIQNFYSSIK